MRRRSKSSTDKQNMILSRPFAGNRRRNEPRMKFAPQRFPGRVSSCSAGTYARPFRPLELNPSSPQATYAGIRARLVRAPVVDRFHRRQLAAHAPPLKFLLWRFLFVIVLMGAIADADWRHLAARHQGRARRWLHAAAGRDTSAAYSSSPSAGMSAGLSALIVGMQPPSDRRRRPAGRRIGRHRRQWLGLAGRLRASAWWCRTSWASGLASTPSRRTCSPSRHHRRDAVPEALLRPPGPAHAVGGAVHRHRRRGAVAAGWPSRRGRWCGPGPLIFAIGWLVVVLSSRATTLLLMLIRRCRHHGFGRWIPGSAAGDGAGGFTRCSTSASPPVRWPAWRDRPGRRGAGHASRIGALPAHSGRPTRQPGKRSEGTRDRRPRHHQPPLAQDSSPTRCRAPPSRRSSRWPVARRRAPTSSPGRCGGGHRRRARPPGAPHPSRRN